MTTSAQHIFEATVQKTEEILQAIDDRFRWNDNRNRSYLALRAVLQTLRDRLPVEEAVALGAQLPMLVRGFYYDGWRPAVAPRKMNKDEFIGEVERHVDPLSFDQSTEEVISGVLALVESYIDPAEMRKVKKLLPKDIQRMLSVA